MDRGQFLRDPAAPQPAPPTTDFGTMLANYQILSLVGRGGMSEVYEAFDLRLARRVALKVLDRELARSRSFRDRFIRESRLASGLSHPHVIPIFEAGEQGDTLYIAMHLVDGPDLGTLIERRGALPVDLTRDLLSQSASALDAAHAAGLLHRDVKPANLLVAGDADTPHVYLSDFGLTKSLGRDTRITETGQLLGSVHYVPPEHVEGRATDHRADVYSLGCVLFECLTGSPPYERDSDMSVLWAHLNAEIPRPSKRNRTLPDLVDRVIARALAKDPADRFQTCGELAESFASAVEGIAWSLPAALPRSSKLSMQRRLAAVTRKGAAVVASLMVIGAAGSWALEGLVPDDSERSREQISDVGSKRRGSGDRQDALPADAKAQGKAREKGSGPEGSDNTVKSPTRGDGTEADSPPGSRSDLPVPIAVAGGESLQSTRTLTSRYDVTASGLRGLRDCTPDDTAQGCLVFTLNRDESFVDISLQDDLGFPVNAWVRQDANGDSRWEGAWKRVCSETQEPLEVPGGARIQILVDDAACDGDSQATTGLVELALYRRVQ